MARTAVKVENVSKDFVLPHEKVNSIKSAFTTLTQRQQKKIRDTQHALKDISFEVKEGEFFGIVGRNGSGKSTLLKILAQIYQPTKGTVTTHGKLVPFIELGVGFNPELTGRENVYLNGAMLGFSEKEIEKMYDDIVSFAELEEFMDQKLKNYSSGMQVRLAFSMATRSESDILLVDEVLAVGDADFQRKCFQYFRELKRKKKTVVFVTHDMGAINDFCDRAMLIEKSEVKRIDRPSVIADAYTMMFIDQSPLNQGEQDTSDELNERKGDAAVQFRDATVELQGARKEEVVLTTDIIANRDVEVPQIGFMVRNYQDMIILGTNNKKERYREIKKLAEGDTLTLEWRFPNILNEGQYYFDLSLSYHNGVIADRWRSALELKVLRDDKTPFLVNPRVHIEKL